MKPLVDGVKPPKMPKKRKDGIVKWLKTITGIEVEESKPKKNPNNKFKRKQLISFLEKNGIESRPIIVGNLQKHPVGKIFKEFGKKKFPNADYLHNKGIYIGLNPITDDKTFKKMMKTFENFLNR